MIYPSPRPLPKCQARLRCVLLRPWKAIHLIYFIWMRKANHHLYLLSKVLSSRLAAISVYLIPGSGCSFTKINKSQIYSYWVGSLYSVGCVSTLGPCLHKHFSWGFSGGLNEKLTNLIFIKLESFNLWTFTCEISIQSNKHLKIGF